MLTIYSKDNCPNCVQAKNILDAKSIPYEEVKIDVDEDARSFIAAEGHRSVPQIYKDGKLFVANGHLGLLRLMREGKLK